ncbi:unnamed protein product [Gadus morhua 'NCC']
MRMKRVLLVALLHVLFDSRNLCLLGSVIRKDTTYNFKLPSTWLEAREHCRSHSGVLALLTQQSDVDLLDPYIYLSWIGLYKAADGDWKWSDGKSYENACYKWLLGCEDNNGDCAAANSTEGSKHQSQDCDDKLFFYCSNVDSTVTFVPMATTWENARNYCQQRHKDLVTLESGTTANDLSDDLFYIWTGLHRAQPGADWEWSIGRADYENWEEGNGPAEGDCVGLSNTENSMTNLDCNSTWPFYCYFDNLVLVKENKTWEEALEHCRAMDLVDPQRNDLISISGPLDHHTVWFRINKATTNEVWTGLRYLAHKWFWVDGTDVPYLNLPTCPDLGKHCGTVDRDNSTIPWIIRDCNEKRNFLCYKKY